MAAENTPNTQVSKSVIDNRAYQRRKQLHEALSAWLFLLPNFLGFLIITFFPIFAVFLLSLTQWDGLSAATEPEVKIEFSLAEGTEETVTLPKGTKLTMLRAIPIQHYQNVTVTYKINKDIIIPPGTTEVYLSDLQVLREWTLPSNIDENGNYIITPVKESVSADLQKYLEKPGSMFFDEQNIGSMNIRFKKIGDTFKGVNIVYDKSKAREKDPAKRKEIILVLNKSEQQKLVPAGTEFLADLNFYVTTRWEKREWVFYTPENIKLSPGKSKKLLMKATEKGEMFDVSGLVEKDLYFDVHSDLPVKARAHLVSAKGNSGWQIKGFINFEEIIFRDARFKLYFINTLIFLLEIPLGMALSLIMALAMNQPLKGIVVFRVLFFLPVISNIVAVALLWRWIFNTDYGFLNQFLRVIGIANPPNWFGDRGWARVAIIVVDVWKNAGYNMMLYLAGLQGIPHYLYEAAEIDGASGLQQFWRITWPLLSPTNFFILIMGVIGGFQAFGTQYVLTSGGPAGATTTIVYYIYNNAFQWSKMGYASAIAVILFFFVMTLTIINWRVSEGKVEY